MEKKILRLIFLISIICLLVACSGAPANTCLPPPLATVPAIMGNPRQQSGDGVIPQGGITPWWVAQPANFPFSITPKDQIDWTINDIVIQKDGVLWIALSIFQSTEKKFARNNIIRYNPVTGDSHVYQIATDDQTSPFIVDLLLAKNDQLWAVAIFPTKQSTSLIYYNHQSDKFEFVPFVSKNKPILESQNNKDYAVYVHGSVLTETPDGNILMPFGKNIVSYNPLTHEATLLLPENFPSYISTTLVYQDKVWFTEGGIVDKSWNEDMDLRSINLKTGELINYGHAPSILDDPKWSSFMFASHRPIAVDGLGHIWVGYFARLKLQAGGTYIWEKITYPPEFVLVDDPDIQYVWAQTNSIFTASNGNLWFTTNAGLVQYDVSLNKWCKSTSIVKTISVTEDKQGNLWMADDHNGFLYKYTISP